MRWHGVLGETTLGKSKTDVQNNMILVERGEGEIAERLLSHFDRLIN